MLQRPYHQSMMIDEAYLLTTQGGCVNQQQYIIWTFEVTESTVQPNPGIPSAVFLDV